MFKSRQFSFISDTCHFFCREGNPTIMKCILCCLSLTTEQTLQWIKQQGPLSALRSSLSFAPFHYQLHSVSVCWVVLDSTCQWECGCGILCLLISLSIISPSSKWQGFLLSYKGWIVFHLAFSLSIHWLLGISTNLYSVGTGKNAAWNPGVRESPH